MDKIVCAIGIFAFIIGLYCIFDVLLHKRKSSRYIFLCSCAVVFLAFFNYDLDNVSVYKKEKPIINENVTKIDLSSIPEYSSSPYVVINNNNPYFDSSDLTDKSYEDYGDLDVLGRCSRAIASIGKDLMPNEDRTSIGMIKPSGWRISKYDDIDGKYLYNRCHLIGYQLTGENANERNLITGTRYMNVQGMLPFENMVADYIRETGNHVLYRVTPIFKEDNLLASGVLMEALSVEDNGKGIKFNVYCYNVQPGIVIDYSDGSNYRIGVNNVSVSEKYVINTNTGVFHKEGCSSVLKMSNHNKEVYDGSRDDLISKGYKPCSLCNP